MSRKRVPEHGLGNVPSGTRVKQHPYNRLRCFLPGPGEGREVEVSWVYWSRDELKPSGSCIPHCVAMQGSDFFGGSQGAGAEHSAAGGFWRPRGPWSPGNR